MTKARVVNTRFWDDHYTSNLDPVEKLMFLYFLTNTSTNICGIYECPLKKVAMDTGIDKDMVVKIIDRFTKDGKIYYVEGWVGIKNFVKNQNQRSPQVIKGIENEITAIPKDIMDKMIGLGYPMDTVSYLIQSNLIKSNTKYNPMGSDIIKKFEDIDSKNKLNYNKPAQRSACDFLLKEYGLEKVFQVIEIIKQKRGTPYFPSITTPYELQMKWTKVGEALMREKSSSMVNNKSRQAI
jgi:hypothetical protein